MGYQRPICIGLRSNKNYNYKSEYENGGKRTRHIRSAPTTRTNNARLKHNGEALPKSAAGRLRSGSWHLDETQPVSVGGYGPNTEAKGIDGYVLSPHTDPARKPPHRLSLRGLNNARTSNPEIRIENQERPSKMASQEKSIGGSPTESTSSS